MEDCSEMFVPSNMAHPLQMVALNTLSADNLTVNAIHTEACHDVQQGVTPCFKAFNLTALISADLAIQ